MNVYDILTIFIICVLFAIYVLRNNIQEYIFVLICLLLLFIKLKNIGATDHFVQSEPKEEVFNIHEIDYTAFKELTDLPSAVQSMIEPPLQRMIDNASGKNPPAPLDDMTSVSPDLYKNDTYVGTVVDEMKKDMFGKEKMTTTFTLDNDKFTKMKQEYKMINRVLDILETSDPKIFSSIIV